MNNTNIVSKEQIKKIILEKIINNLKENDEDLESFEDDDVESFEDEVDDISNSITQDILDLLTEKCINIVSDDNLMRNIQNGFNKKKKFTDNLPFFNKQIKKTINAYLSKKIGFEKLCQEDQNLKIYFTQWKQIPIDNYSEYKNFFNRLVKGEEITDASRKEYNEVILKSKFKILINGDEKKICAMLDASEAETIRKNISYYIDDNENLYIKSQKSDIYGDEDWIDYFEGDEGDGFSALTNLTATGSIKNLFGRKAAQSVAKVAAADTTQAVTNQAATKTAKSAVKKTFKQNPPKNNFKVRNPNHINRRGKKQKLNNGSFIKDYDKNKLNEAFFLAIPILKFIGSAIAWATADYFLNKYLVIPDSNWIESRKLYVFDYENEIDDINNIIEEYKEFINNLKSQHGGVDPTEITDKVIDVFIYFLENLEKFSKTNNLPLANNRQKLELINKDIKRLEHITYSDNKMNDFREFLKLDNSQKSAPSISLLKNFKSIIKEKNIDLEEDKEYIGNEILNYYLEKFNEKNHK